MACESQGHRWKRSTFRGATKPPRRRCRGRYTASRWSGRRRQADAVPARPRQRRAMRIANSVRVASSTSAALQPTTQWNDPLHAGHRARLPPAVADRGCDGHPDVFRPGQPSGGHLSNNEVRCQLHCPEPMILSKLRHHSPVDNSWKHPAKNHGTRRQ